MTMMWITNDRYQAVVVQLRAELKEYDDLMKLKEKINNLLV